MAIPVEKEKPKWISDIIGCSTFYDRDIFIFSNRKAEESFCIVTNYQ